MFFVCIGQTWINAQCLQCCDEKSSNRVGKFDALDRVVNSLRRRMSYMRKDIQFQTEDGVTLRGWHYLPDGVAGKVPTIVMAHGFSAVKEMYLDRFADAFAAAA